MLDHHRDLTNTYTVAHTHNHTVPELVIIAAQRAHTCMLSWTVLYTLTAPAEKKELKKSTDTPKLKHYIRNGNSIEVNTIENILVVSCNTTAAGYTRPMYF